MEHAEATQHAEHATTTGIDHRKMLIWAFLGSECMFFGSLIATYLVYYGQSISGPGPADVLDINTTTVSTFVLLMSSFMMVMSYSAVSRGDLKRFRIWIVCTALLGATFLGFQFFEFTEFAHHHQEFECPPALDRPAQYPDEACMNGATTYEANYGLTPRTNLFGSTFFTLTGFHGAHVTVGVIWLLSLFGYSFRRRGEDLIRDGGLNVDLAALYWHFVDIVWIVIFTVVYLIGVTVA